MKKYIAGFCIAMVLLVQTVMAKNYAYVYIEGDKQTPFYVKIEGQMMPRLGKNYCILPNLDKGVTNIEILFQQNQFPSQKFTLQIPEGGSRGFLLKKVNGKQFALYDMTQDFYLVAGNKAEDDHVPAVNEAPAVTPVQNVVASTPVTAEVSNDVPAFDASKKAKTKGKIKTTTPKPAVVKENNDDGNDKKFISDIELNTGAAAAPVVAVPEKPANRTTKRRPVKQKEAEGDLPYYNEKGEKTSQAAAPVVADAANGNSVPNTDCKTAMSNDDFENFATKILDRSDDDARLKVLSKNKGKYCFTTEQVRIIANNLETQSGRYEVTKLLYPQVSDQSNYPKLEALFKTNYLKQKFREVINPK